MNSPFPTVRPAVIPLRPAAPTRPVSLSEILDRVLNKGAVVAGEVVISVAGVELIYLGVNVVLTSVATGRDGGTGGMETLDAMR